MNASTNQPKYNEIEEPGQIISATKRDLEGLRTEVSHYFSHKIYFPNFSTPEKVGICALFGKGTYYATYVLQRKELITFELWHVGRAKGKFNHYTLAQIYLNKNVDDVIRIEATPVEIRKTLDEQLLCVIADVLEKSQYIKLIGNTDDLREPYYKKK